MRSRKFSRSLVLAFVLGTSSVVPGAAASAQPAPDVTVASSGTFDTTGNAAVSGTFSCGDNTGFAFVEVVLRQNVGRVSTVSGNGFAEIPPCSPAATGTWSAVVVPSGGQFRGGPAQASAQLVVEDTLVAETAATLRLRR